MTSKANYTAIGKSTYVTWTETRRITIGHHSCMRCGEKTPQPTDDQKLEFAQAMGDKQHEYMWPNRHEGEGFVPVGWSWFSSQHHSGWLCFDCTQKVNGLISDVK